MIGDRRIRSLSQKLALIDVGADAAAIKLQGFRARMLYPEPAGRADSVGGTRHRQARGVHLLCTPFDDDRADALGACVPITGEMVDDGARLP